MRIELFLLPFPRRRAIVGHAALLGTFPAMLPSAAKRTTQVPPAYVPGIRQKTQPAGHAANHATLQLGMALQHKVQGQQILPDQRPGTVVLVPISSRSEELPDRNDKKARFWVTLEKMFFTPSSYLTEANAS
jgi:hypothetical protein